MELVTTREHISDAIAVEQVSDNTFLSKSLWTPYGHPSAYGGQLMAQAVHVVSLYATPGFALHCCFLHSTSDDRPVKYRAYNLKQGRTFSSYIVKASQKGKFSMVLTCWFQKLEPSRGPSTQWPIPKNFPLPEELELDMNYYLTESVNADGEMKQALMGIAEDRERIPIILTVSTERMALDGHLMSARWMRVPSAEGCRLAVQKSILAYMSDFDFIGVAPKALKLKRLGHGPGTVEAISTLSHSMQFYCNNIDCSEWLLFVISAPRAGFGRASVLGQFYTRDGTLVAVVMQEGLLAARDTFFLQRARPHRRRRRARHRKKQKGNSYLHAYSQKCAASHYQTLAVDLLNPSAESEKRRHKLKRLVQSPNSYFMDVKCSGCFTITTVFSHAQTVVTCGSCGIVLTQPTGGRARLTEGSSYRRKN
ncbi:RAD14 [Sanghuangporus sanghuang]